MKAFPSEGNIASLEAYQAEAVLTDWLKTIMQFHNYYHQLISCIDRIVHKQDLTTSNTIYIGQCPLNLLLGLTSTMQEELINLSQDMDQLPSLESSNTVNKYKKLAAHTRLLSQLNQQAQNRLYLVTLPNS